MTIINLEGNYWLKKWIKNLIEANEDEIKRLKGMWNKIPPERIADAYSDLGETVYKIGLCNIALGNKQEALNLFKKAVEYYKKAKEHLDKAKPEISYSIFYVNYFIYSAILTQDEKIIKEIAQHMCDVEETILNKYPKRKRSIELRQYRRAFILANLITGNDGKTRERLAAFERYHKSKSLIPGEYPITVAVKGILEKDPKLTKEGTDKLLKRHIGMVRRRSAISSEEMLVCVPAICMLILVKLKGMNINEIYIESEYAPKFLFEDQ